MLTERDYYAVLGVSRSATVDEIRVAYRRAARASHPDLHPDDTSAHERFKRIQAAYEVLGNPARRAAYDAPPREPIAAAPPRPPAAPSADRPPPAARRPPDPPVSLARELGETFAALRVVARRSGFTRRVNRLIRYLERL